MCISVTPYLPVTNATAIRSVFVAFILGNNGKVCFLLNPSAPDWKFAAASGLGGGCASPIVCP